MDATAPAALLTLDCGHQRRLPAGVGHVSVHTDTSWCPTCDTDGHGITAARVEA